MNKSTIGAIVFSYSVLLSPSLNNFEYKNLDVVSTAKAPLDTREFEDRFNNRKNYRIFDKSISTDETIKYNLEETKTAIITYGTGGTIDGMLESLRYIKENPDALVVIDGPCYSACAMLLAASPNQVKYTERASFFLHAASKEGQNGDRVINKWLNLELQNLFQRDIAAWIRDNKVFTSLTFKQLSFGLLYMSYPDKFIDSSKINILHDLNYQDFSFMKSKKTSRN